MSGAAGGGPVDGAGPGATAEAGHWVELRPAVWETVVRACDCCGQVVPKRLWVVDVEGSERRFCGTECESLYRSYVLPKLAR